MTLDNPHFLQEIQLGLSPHEIATGGNMHMNFDHGEFINNMSALSEHGQSQLGNTVRIEMPTGGQISGKARVWDK